MKNGLRWQTTGHTMRVNRTPIEVEGTKGVRMHPWMIEQVAREQRRELLARAARPRPAPHSDVAKGGELYGYPYQAPPPGSGQDSRGPHAPEHGADPGRGRERGRHGGTRRPGGARRGGSRGGRHVGRWGGQLPSLSPAVRARPADRRRDRRRGQAQRGPPGRQANR